MDSLLSLGSKYLNDQNSSSGGGGGNEGGGNGGGGFNFTSLASLAQDEDRENSGNSDLFRTAASFLKNQSNPSEEVDEEDLRRTHEQVYQQQEQEGGGGGQADSSQIGKAAAVSTIKNLLSGGGLAGLLSAGGSGGGGGGIQQKIISMAMAQAASTFDAKEAKGQVSAGDKQDAVNSAGDAAMKLALKYGAGGDMGVLASKFM